MRHGARQPFGGAGARIDAATTNEPLEGAAGTDAAWAAEAAAIAEAAAEAAAADQELRLAELELQVAVLEEQLFAVSSDRDELKQAFDTLTATHDDLEKRYAKLETAHAATQRSLKGLLGDRTGSKPPTTEAPQPDEEERSERGGAARERPPSKRGERDSTSESSRSLRLDAARIQRETLPATPEAGPLTRLMGDWWGPSSSAELSTCSSTAAVSSSVPTAPTAPMPLAASPVASESSTGASGDAGKRAGRRPLPDGAGLSRRAGSASPPPIWTTNRRPILPTTTTRRSPSPQRTAVVDEAGNPIAGLVSSTYKDPAVEKMPLDEVLERGKHQLDPSCLECYLTDRSFEATLGMDRKTFYSVQTWKQRQLKQEAGLF